MYINWNGKNSLEEFTVWYEQEEEKFKKHKDGKIEVIDSKEQKEKWLKKSEHSLMDLQDTIKWINIYILWESQRRERKKKSREDIGRNNDRNFSNFDEIHKYKHLRCSTNFK